MHVVPSTQRGSRSEDPEACARTLQDAWSSISSDVTLHVDVDPRAAPLLDARVVAAVTAVLHAAADRARRTVQVEVAADDTLRVHDDGERPELRPGVLTTAARDALVALGADLLIDRSPVLGGTRCTIVRPAPPPPAAA